MVLKILVTLTREIIVISILKPLFVYNQVVQIVQTVMSVISLNILVKMLLVVHSKEPRMNVLLLQFLVGLATFLMVMN